MTDDLTPAAGAPVSTAPHTVPGQPPQQHPWMTNGLLAVVVTLLGTGGVVGKGAYDDLREGVREMQREVSKISATLR